MIDEPEHPYLGAEFGRRYVDPSTAANAQQAGEYIASNAAFRQRQDAQEQAARREAALLDGQSERRTWRMTADEKIERKRAFDMLGSLLGEINGLYDCVGYDAPKLIKWKRRAARILASIYGETSSEVEWLLGNAFPATGAAYKWEGGMLGETLDMLQREFTKMRDSFAENEHKSGTPETAKVAKRARDLNYERVFIVHGHDAALRSEVARLMEKVGIKPIILSEQPNCGSTIIEKIEKNSDVGAAICLFTADDECKDGTKRARQNVALETGYFWGKLGRDKMVILADKGVELPSDMQGVVYTDTVNWRFSVCRELRQMGYDIDLNRIV